LALGEAPAARVMAGCALIGVGLIVMAAFPNRKARSR